MIIEREYKYQIDNDTYTMLLKEFESKQKLDEFEFIQSGNRLIIDTYFDTEKYDFLNNDIIFRQRKISKQKIYTLKIPDSTQNHEFRRKEFEGAPSTKLFDEIYNALKQQNIPEIGSLPEKHYSHFNEIESKLRLSEQFKIHKQQYYTHIMFNQQKAATLTIDKCIYKLGEKEHTIFELEIEEANENPHFATFIATFSDAYNNYLKEAKLSKHKRGVLLFGLND